MSLTHAQARGLAEYIDRALTDLADQHAHEARAEEEEIDASANGHGPVSRPGPRDPEPVARPLSAPVGGGRTRGGRVDRRRDTAAHPFGPT